jgi:hypothetical protein
MPTVNTYRQRMKHPKKGGPNERLIVVHVDGTFLGVAGDQSNPLKQTAVAARLDGRPDLPLRAVAEVVVDGSRLQVHVFKALQFDEAGRPVASQTPREPFDDPDPTAGDLIVTIDNPNPDGTGTVEAPIDVPIPVDLVTGDPCNP